MPDRVRSLTDEAARLRTLAGASDADIAAKLLTLANEIEALARELLGASDCGSPSTVRGVRRYRGRRTAGDAVGGIG